MFKKIIDWIKTAFNKTIGKLITELKRKSSDKNRKKIQENMTDILKSIEEASSNNFESTQSFEAYRDNPEYNKDRMVNAGRRSYSKEEILKYRDSNTMNGSYTTSNAIYDMVSKELIREINKVLPYASDDGDGNIFALRLIDGSILCSENGDENAYKVLKFFEDRLNVFDTGIKNLHSNMRLILNGEIEDYDEIVGFKTDYIQPIFTDLKNILDGKYDLKSYGQVASEIVKVYAEKGLNSRVLEQIQNFETKKMSGTLSDLIGRYNEILKTVKANSGDNVFNPEIAYVGRLERTLTFIQKYLSTMNVIVNRITMIYGRKLKIFNIIDKYVSDK